MTKISQQEARRLKWRVNELERVLVNQRRRYTADYPGGVHIATLTYDFEKSFIPAVVDNSRLLGHGVVAVADGRLVRLYALPHPDTTP